MEALLEAARSSVPMDCEETVTSLEEAPKRTHEALVGDTTKALAVESANDQTDTDGSSSLNDTDRHPNSAEVPVVEMKSELTAHTKEVSSVNEQNENTKMECSAQVKESKAQTTKSGRMEITDESNPATETQSSAVKPKEAPSASVQESSVEKANQNKQLDIEMECSAEAEESKAQKIEFGLMEITDESNSATKNQSSTVELKEAPSASAQGSSVEKASQNKELDTITEKADATGASVKINLEAEKSKQALSMDSSPKKSGGIKSQTLAQKRKTTKIISLSKLAPNSGKAVNIQIVSKDQKTAMNVNVAPSIVKRVLAPKESTSKRLPLILPKNPPPTTVSSAVPLTSAPTKNLKTVLIPKNYLLIQTKAGLSLMPFEQVKNGTIKTSGAESKKVPSFSGLQNINICNTSNSLSVGISNTPVTSKTSRPIMSLSSPLKIPTPRFSTSPIIRPVSSDIGSRPQLKNVSKNSPLLLSTAKVLEQAKTKASTFIDLCQHPTCSTYRNKVIEELQFKMKMRDRKLKCLRMGKDRSVKRAVSHAQMVKNLQRQRAVLLALESFPDDLSKTLMKAQLKPNGGVRANSLHEKKLKEFATQLHLISPKAYNIVRGIFDKVLPESASMDNWNFARAEVRAMETAEKAANSDENEESDSESDGEGEMVEEES